jgi:hypothetical protein
VDATKMNIDRDAASELFGSKPPRPAPSLSRPSALVTACAVIMALGVMTFISATGSLLLSSGDRVEPAMRGLGVLDEWGRRHFNQVAAAQLVWGGLTIVSGVGTWYGWPWSRRISQVLMAVWALAIASFGTAMAITVVGFSGPQPFTAAFFGFWRAMAVGVGLMWAATGAVPVWLLERPEARNWRRAHAG